MSIYQPVMNQQLFSAMYLQDLRQAKYLTDQIDACYQNIYEWREANPDLENDSNLQQYVRYCLAQINLCYSIPSQQTVLKLHVDTTQNPPVGICLVVNDPDLGCTTKGSHHQVDLIKQLRNASLSWGMITNGKRWRLCYAGSVAPYEVFLEIDLDIILKERRSLDFVFFYLFFGQQAFTTDQRAVISCGQLGLDTHLQASEKRVEAIHHYLRGSIEMILQQLCLGFVKDEDIENYTREALDTTYCNAIYFLYRILFLFYAEARGLLPVHHTSYQQMSLARLVAEAYQYHHEGIHGADTFSLWRQLDDLCNMIDRGKPEIGVNPYNGGLFSNEKHPYFETHKMANAYLAPALFALGYVQEKNRVHVPIDYSDLSVRHLGTLYEGLLECRLHRVENERIVVRENNGSRSYIPISHVRDVKRSDTILEIGRVYFADDRGERKSSGAYSTPEDAVQYIVSHTVLPKLQECSKSWESLLAQIQSELIIAANEEEQCRLQYYADDKIMEIVERDLLSLRILDPAMGSGHFLVAAGQVMTNFIVELLNRTMWPNPSVSSDPLLWKRRIVERCLYGVDINPLAHELAKLALWLSSARNGKPLTFLDHHLKVGNSLYGAPLMSLSSFPLSKEKHKNDDLQQYIHQHIFHTIREDLREITSKDSNHIDDVQAKEKVYHRIMGLTQCVHDIANLWLASLLTLKKRESEPIREQEYLHYVAELTNHHSSETWHSLAQKQQAFLAARAIADKEKFFHWEIEFPDALIDGMCHFHVIITNPPYVGTPPNQIITALYGTAKCRDLYAWFCERILSLRSSAGIVGLIVPLSMMFSKRFVSLRKSFLGSQTELYCSSFDNTPDVLFKSSMGKANQQRASIVIF